MQFFPDIIIGLALALVGWIVAQRLLTPRLLFARMVCLPRRDAADQQSVRIKFKNASWYREIHSLQIVTRIRIKGLNPSRPEVAHFVDLVPETATVAVVKPQGNRVIRTSARSLSDTSFLLIRRFIPSFNVDRDKVTIHDLLCVPRTEVTLMVQIECTDPWSGTTTVRTHEYRASDVVDGDFVVSKNRWTRMVMATHRWRERLAQRTHRIQTRLHRELGHVERPASPWEQQAIPQVAAHASECAGMSSASGRTEKPEARKAVPK